jgi:LuxR family maltose regulon positive regulatory protein
VIALAHVAHARGLELTKLVPAADRLLDLIDRTPRRQLTARRHYRVLAVNNAAGGQLWSGEFGAAEVGFTKALAGARALGMELPALNGEGHLALLDVMHGRLRRGHRRAISTLRSLDRRGWGSETQALAVYLALAVTHLCWNQPEQAATHIERGLVASLRDTDVGCRLGLRIAALRLVVAGGNIALIRAAAVQFQDELSRCGAVPDLLARWCVAALADALVAAGDANTALAEIAPPGDRTGLAASLERLVAGRAHLALGRPETALDVLRPMLGDWRPFLPQGVEARILAASAMHTMGRLSDALGAVAEAVGLAEPEGLVGPFVAGGFPVSQLLARFRMVERGHRPFTDQILAAVG